MRNRTRGVAGLVFLSLWSVACGDGAGPGTVSTVSEPPAVTTLPATTSPVTTSMTMLSAGVTVTGIVIDVDGNLAATDLFVIRLESGDDLTLVPADGLLFDGVAPLTHLRDHLVSGNPIQVTYEISSDGPAMATAVGEAGGDTHSHDD